MESNLEGDDAAAFVQQPKGTWSMFSWIDHDADERLRVCSLAAQGLWMRMLCIMAKAVPVGELRINGTPCSARDLARLSSEYEEIVVPLLAELEERGVFSRTADGVIYSRRIRKDGVSSGNLRENRPAIPMSLRNVIFRRDKSTCQYCGSMQGPFEIDHIIPWSKGGRHKMKNLKVACKPCNRSKGAKPLDQWRPN